MAGASERGMATPSGDGNQSTFPDRRLSSVSCQVEEIAARSAGRVIGTLWFEEMSISPFPPPPPPPAGQHDRHRAGEAVVHVVAGEDRCTGLHQALTVATSFTSPGRAPAPYALAPSPAVLTRRQAFGGGPGGAEESPGHRAGSRQASSKRITPLQSRLPALLGVAGHGMGGAAVRAVSGWAWGPVWAHGAPPGYVAAVIGVLGSSGSGGWR